MQKNIYKIIFLLNIMLFLLIGSQMLRYWFNPFLWDWPSIIHARVYNLLLVESVAIIIFTLLVRVKVNELWIKALALLIFSGVNFLLFIFFGMVNPFLRYEDPLALRQGLDSVKFETLAPCDRVKLFSEVAGELVSYSTGKTGEPVWMHQSLMKIPQQTLRLCFSEEITKTVSAITSSRGFNEVAVKRLYALTFEAERLKVISQPSVLSALKTAVCTPGADPFGNLAGHYYFTSNGDLPDYYNHSTNAQETLRNEICGE